MTSGAKMKSDNIIQIKSYVFAVRIVRLYQHLTATKKEYALSKQLLRSGTSIGANVEEAIGGQSRADFGRKRKMLMLSVPLMMALALFAGCGSSPGGKGVKGEVEAGRLLSFSYRYSTFRYRAFVYTVTRETGEDGAERIHFKAEGYSDGLISVEEEIGEAVVDEVVRIMAEEDIFAWDGFKKYDKEVLDGFSFDLRARFEHRDIKASGYVSRPANFKGGHDRLSAYLLELAQSFGKE